MNTEILFSMNPFLITNNNENNDNNFFKYITPNKSIDIESKTDPDNNKLGLTNETEYEIPNEYKNENLFIEVISDTLNVSKPFYNDNLVVSIQENHGQLKVLLKDNQTDTLVPAKKAYVKVYAKMNNYTNEFYKDGYTDISGKFDYVSISTDQLDRTQEFAIFIQYDGYGSVVKTASVPQR